MSATKLLTVLTAALAATTTAIISKITSLIVVTATLAASARVRSSPVSLGRDAHAVTASATASAPVTHVTAIERAALTDDLSRLDEQFRDGLADCASRDLVTSHEAFGYLADAYGLRQVGITGLSPEAEPDPQERAAAAEMSREHR